MPEETVYRYKMIISYDGTHYCGWQIQPNAVSIQEEIEKALYRMFQKVIRIHSAGRTDAGVHAMGQVCHFNIEKSIIPEDLQRSLNGLLPHDIRIKEIEEVDLEFHARFSAKSKSYHYHIWLDPVRDPFWRHFSYYEKRRISFVRLKQAAKLFEGTHDFSSFANCRDGRDKAVNPIRTIDKVRVVRQRGGVRIEFYGKSFLYKMVRNMVGAILEVASGKASLEDIETIFAAKDRKQAFKAIPPEGLFLMEVRY